MPKEASSQRSSRHYCGTLGKDNIGDTVCVCGWVDRRRDHGGVIFLDLRDRSGVMQVVVDVAATGGQEVFDVADQVRNEYVLQLGGVVRARDPETINPDMPTGMVEISCTELTVLNEAQPPSFQIDEYTDVKEEVRLKYRYLDLRRSALQDKLKLRARLLSVMRRYLEDHDFWEIETPILTKSTPEGARDYLVPSRLNTGNAYALPQSPQLYKQLLMAGGLDRYYQVARCFRDEDLRADRQPEFTQLDMEASFVDEHFVMVTTEGLLKVLFEELLGVSLADFPRLSHADVVSRFGTDKPDLRNPLELVDISSLVSKVEFDTFRKPATREDSRVVILRVPGGGSLSRGEIDKLADFVATYGARGLAWIKVEAVDQGMAGLQSPILKFLGDRATRAILKQCAVQDGDIVFFGAGPNTIVNQSMGALRERLGQDMDLLQEDWRPLWVVDFPLFDVDSDGRMQSVHHPFTAPLGEVDNKQLRKTPLKFRSRAYDLVCNGVELGGGSVRIHDTEQQLAALSVLGFDKEEAYRRFGFLLDALSSGCPPHAGIALGIDRLVAMLSSATSIRDVMAFPKTQSAACPVTGAPTDISRQQAKELQLSFSPKSSPRIK